MKIIFMGTPDFAVPSLKAMIKEQEVLAVFTQPDRPKGRGKKLGISPIKEIAIENQLPVYQPVRLKARCYNSCSLWPDPAKGDTRNT